MANTLDQAFKWTIASEHRNRLTNIYEPIQPYLLAEFAKYLGSSVFLDIGANIGFYSVVMGTETEAQTIHAYEPIAPAFAELKKNLSLNGLSARSTACKLALSSNVGEAEMLVISALSGANAIRDTSFHGDKKSEKIERVPVSTLDHEFSFEGKKISIKIDVEGHETQVLSGGPRLLEKNTCIIQFESLGGESHHKQCEDILTSLGYREMIAVGPDRYFSNMYFHANDVILCVSKALSRFVEDFKKPPIASVNSPIRRRLFRGVTVELSPGLSRRLRKNLRRTAG